MGAHIHLITQVKATGKRIKCWTRLFRTGALKPLEKREKTHRHSNISSLRLCQRAFSSTYPSLQPCPLQWCVRYYCTGPIWKDVDELRKGNNEEIIRVQCAEGKYTVRLPGLYTCWEYDGLMHTLVTYDSKQITQLHQTCFTKHNLINRLLQ